MRLIDADKLKAEVEAMVEHKVQESDYDYGRNQILDYVADILIEDAPTVDKDVVAYDYIEEEAEHLWHCYGEELDENLTPLAQEIKEAFWAGWRIGQQDAVEVVRCRDCKFQTVSFVDGSDYTCIRWHAKRAVMREDFCSYGERREDATD